MAVAVAFFAGFAGLWLLDAAPAPEQSPPTAIKRPTSQRLPYAEGEQHLLTTSVLGSSAVEIAPTGYAPAMEPGPLVEPPTRLSTPATIDRDIDGVRERDVRRVVVDHDQPDPAIQPRQPDVETQVVLERERIGRELRRRAEPISDPRLEQARQLERLRDVHAAGRAPRTP